MEYEGIAMIFSKSETDRRANAVDLYRSSLRQDYVITEDGQTVSFKRISSTRRSASGDSMSIISASLSGAYGMNLLSALIGDEETIRAEETKPLITRLFNRLKAIGDVGAEVAKDAALKNGYIIAGKIKDREVYFIVNSQVPFVHSILIDSQSFEYRIFRTDPDVKASSPELFLEEVGDARLVTLSGEDAELEDIASTLKALVKSKEESRPSASGLTAKEIKDLYARLQEVLMPHRFGQVGNQLVHEGKVAECRGRLSFKLMGNGSLLIERYAHGEEYGKTWSQRERLKLSPDGAIIQIKKPFAGYGPEERLLLEDERPNGILIKLSQNPSREPSAAALVVNYNVLSMFKGELPYSTYLASVPDAQKLARQPNFVFIAIGKPQSDSIRSSASGMVVETLNAITAPISEGTGRIRELYRQENPDDAAKMVFPDTVVIMTEGLPGNVTGERDLEVSKTVGRESNEMMIAMRRFFPAGVREVAAKEIVGVVNDILRNNQGARIIILDDGSLSNDPKKGDIEGKPGKDYCVITSNKREEIPFVNLNAMALMGVAALDIESKETLFRYAYGWFTGNDDVLDNGLDILMQNIKRGIAEGILYIIRVLPQPMPLVNGLPIADQIRKAFDAAA